MMARSLRMRLLLGAAAAIFAALAVAWVVMSFVFEAHIERSVRGNLEQHGQTLIAGLVVAPDGALSASVSPIDPRFNTPASGFYWQITSGAQMLRSRSLWDATLEAGPNVGGDGWSMRDSAGPFEDRLLVVERRIELTGAGEPLLVVLAEDHAAVTAAVGTCRSARGARGRSPPRTR